MLDYTRIINELERSDLAEAAKAEFKNFLNPEKLEESLKRWLGQRDFAHQERRFTRYIALELAWAARTEEQQEDAPLPPSVFTYLFPKSSHIEIKGQLRLGQFLGKEFVVLGGGAQIRIHPLPKAAQPSMPLVMDFTQIPAAIQALKRLALPERNTLEDRINHQSAQEFVQTYEADNPTTLDALKSLIGTRDIRACRAGYTGTPYSAVNALCAQIAWLCVDKTEKNAEETFWQVLYPEITGVTDGMDNTQWPLYGEALLDETKLQLINYRGMVQRSDQITGEGINDQRILFFCEAHLNFWAIPRLERKEAGSALTTLKFENYYQFFAEMSKVLDCWSTRTQGETTEDRLPSQAYKDIMPFQQVLLAHKNLRAKVFPTIFADGVNLGNVVATLIPEDKDQNNKPIKIVRRDGTARETCFLGNNKSLNTILRNLDCIKALEAISLEGVDIPSPFDESQQMQGRDKLYYLPRHYAKLSLDKLSDNELIDLIKGHEKQVIKLSVLVEEFRRRLYASSSKGKNLYNAVFQLNERVLQLEFLKVLLGEDLDFSPVLDDFESALHALKLCDKALLDDRYKSALKTQIENQVLAKVGLGWIEHVTEIQAVGNFEAENWHFIIDGLLKRPVYNSQMNVMYFTNVMVQMKVFEGRNDRLTFATCVANKMAEYLFNHSLAGGLKVLEGLDDDILDDLVIALVNVIDPYVKTENDYQQLLHFSIMEVEKTSMFEALCARANVLAKDFKDEEGKLKEELRRGLRLRYILNSRKEIPALMKAGLFPWLQARIKTPEDLGDFICMLTDDEFTAREAALLEITKTVIKTSEDHVKSFYRGDARKSSSRKSSSRLSRLLKGRYLDLVKTGSDYCRIAKSFHDSANYWAFHENVKLLFSVLTFTANELYQIFTDLEKNVAMTGLEWVFIEKILPSIASYADYCILFHALPTEFAAAVRTKIHKNLLTPGENDSFPEKIEISTPGKMIEFALNQCTTQKEKQEVLRYFSTQINQDHHKHTSVFITLLKESDFETQFDLLMVIKPGQLFVDKTENNPRYLFRRIIDAIKNFSENKAKVYALIKHELHELLVTAGCYALILDEFPEQKNEIYRLYWEDERIMTPSGVREGLQASDHIAAFPEQVLDILEKFGDKIQASLRLYRDTLQNEPGAYKIVCKYLFEHYFDRASDCMSAHDLVDAINIFPVEAWKEPKMRKAAEAVPRYDCTSITDVLPKINLDKLLIAFELFSQRIAAYSTEATARCLNLLPLEKEYFEAFLRCTTTPLNLSLKNKPSASDFYWFFNSLENGCVDLIFEILHRELHEFVKDTTEIIACLDQLPNTTECREFYAKKLLSLMISSKAMREYNFQDWMKILLRYHKFKITIPQEEIHASLPRSIANRGDYIYLQNLPLHPEAPIYTLLLNHLACVQRLYPMLSNGSIFHRQTTAFLMSLTGPSSKHERLEAFFGHLPTDSLLQKTWALVCMADPAARLEATVQACMPITQALYRPSQSTAAAQELREKVSRVFTP